MLLEPTVHGDERGFFLETYRRNTLAEFGIVGDFVQDIPTPAELGAGAKATPPE